MSAAEKSSVTNEAELLHEGRRKFRLEKLSKEAQKNWDHFYRRHGDNFFKDRHWTQREFTDLCPDIQWETAELRIFEAGCGTGNLIYPLLETFSKLSACVCDFSSNAIELVKGHPQYDSSRLSAFVCDLTDESQIDQNILESSVDLVTLIFVLSAVPPEKFSMVLRNLRKVLKVGGSVIFRDYGGDGKELNDHAMLRFGKTSKLGEKFYVRQDNTFSYFFSVDEITQLFASEGFIPQGSVSYVHRETVNKKEQLSVPRVFVQGRFIKS